ncbi:MAG: hypothetical protein VKL59_16725 [Nostocaceae cyanobacterium]|nr:hypothetical protein [Nostocaceae cyanobacterium]
MQVHWKNFFVTTMIWIAGEILLNATGLDNLADYSEFIFEREFALHQAIPVVMCSAII